MKMRILGEFGDQETHTFTCLLLASSHIAGNVWLDEDTEDICIPGIYFYFLLLIPSQSCPGWYERLDFDQLYSYGLNLDANFAELKAKRTTVFLC